MKLLFALMLLSMGVARAEDSLPNVAPTLRPAKVRGVIYKNFIERTENTIRNRVEEVCRFESKTKVFDGTGDGYFVNGELAACDSTVDGKAVKATVWGFMYLSNFTLGGEQKGPVKLASASLHVFAPEGGDRLKPALSASAGSRDLDTVSTVMYIQQMWFSGKEPAKEEQFSATLEFLDDAQ